MITLSCSDEPYRFSARNQPSIGGLKNLEEAMLRTYNVLAEVMALPCASACDQMVERRYNKVCTSAAATSPID